MSDLLAAAAAALGVPEPLVKRAAEARADATGASVDEVLSAWAGGETVAAPKPEEEPAAEPEAAEPEAAAEAKPAEPVGEPAPAPEPAVTAPAAAVAAPSRAPVPTEVTAAEAANLPVVITVPTAGIKERTNFTMPKWLTTVMLIAPLFALFALGGSSTGQCGEATELRADVVTGAIVNCDGTEFTGQAVGGGAANFLAMGRDIYLGSGVRGVNCAGCHAPGGGGIGTNPPQTGVLTTFGACVDHIEWVGKGSQGFRREGLSTYGDTGKPINGGMPGHAGTLTEEQLASVAAFERVQFGGGDVETVLVDCGLVEPAPEEGAEEQPPEEEEPMEGGEEAAASHS